MPDQLFDRPDIQRLTFGFITQQIVPGQIVETITDAGDIRFPVTPLHNHHISASDVSGKGLSPVPPETPDSTDNPSA
jgi:hypothetical protein